MAGAKKKDKHPQIFQCEACGHTNRFHVLEVPREITCNARNCKQRIQVPPAADYEDRGKPEAAANVLIEPPELVDVRADAPLQEGEHKHQTTTGAAAHAAVHQSETLADGENPAGAHDDLGNESLSWLLTLLDTSTALWVKHISLIAVRWLQPHDGSTAQLQQRNRDFFVTGALLVSASAIVACAVIGTSYSWSVGVIRGLAALGLYRSVDLLITVFRTGVFHNFRGDIKLNSAPKWRVRRILVGVLFNYMELVLWYAVIYYSVGISSPTQFNAPMAGIAEALHLSISTMTTVGYGNVAPVELSATLLAVLQVTTSVLLLATVVSVLVSLLGSAKEAPPPQYETQELPCWGVLPFVFGVVGLTLSYQTLSWIAEASPAPRQSGYSALVDSLEAMPETLDEFLKQHERELQERDSTIAQLMKEIEERRLGEEALNQESGEAKNHLEAGSRPARGIEEEGDQF